MMSGTATTRAFARIHRAPAMECALPKPLAELQERAELASATTGRSVRKGLEWSNPSRFLSFCAIANECTQVQPFGGKCSWVIAKRVKVSDAPLAGGRVLTRVSVAARKDVPFIIGHHLFKIIKRLIPITRPQVHPCPQRKGVVAIINRIASVPNNRLSI